MSSSKKARNRNNNNKAFYDIKLLNYAQQNYMRNIIENDIVFGIGSTGTGKTYVAAGFASRELFYRNVNKVVLTRPNIEVGRSLGALPGTLEEKYGPYLAPFDNVFIATLGGSFYDYCKKSRNVDPQPLGYLRGSTFDDAIVLLDEAQNLTTDEMKMLLTRIGRNCKMIISGDPEQSDVKNSGLTDAMSRLENVQGVGVTRFQDDDIVRSAMCKKVILAYRN